MGTQISSEKYAVFIIWGRHHSKIENAQTNIYVIKSE